MKFILLAYALLFAGLHSHSQSIDFADADYCIDWTNENKIRDTRLVVVKINNDLKIRLSTQDSIKCIGYYSSIISSNFYFIDEYGKKVFTFMLLPQLDVALTASRQKGSDETEPELVKILPSIMQIDFPDTTGKIATPLKNTDEYKKEDLLQLKGKILNAHINHSIQCHPDLDTTYRIDFRVRITGECKSINRTPPSN